NAPDPLEHASAEVDLANAQIAMGRPDLADGEFTDDEVAAAELESEGPRGMAADDELDEEADAVTSRRAGRGSRAREILAKAGHDDADGAPPELGDVDDEAALVPHRRARTPVSSNPVIGF